MKSRNLHFVDLTNAVTFLDLWAGCPSKTKNMQPKRTDLFECRPVLEWFMTIQIDQSPFAAILSRSARGGDPKPAERLVGHWDRYRLHCCSRSRRSEYPSLRGQTHRCGSSRRPSCPPGGFRSRDRMETRTRAGDGMNNEF